MLAELWERYPALVVTALMFVPLVVLAVVIHISELVEHQAPTRRDRRS